MPQEPSEAYIVTRDGEKVECLVERLGPTEWQGVPVRDVCIDEVQHSYLDVLPGGHSFSFVILGVEEVRDV